MTETDKHILLAKWLEGTISDKDFQLLENQGELTDLEASLSRLKDYDFAPMNEEKLWKKISEKRKSKKRISPRPLWFGIAASIFLVFGVFWWWNNSGITRVARNGQKRNITLPANSEVTLNSGSKLIYYEKNWDKKRILSLKGEAFFKVTKGVLFQVKSPIGTVEVLGTQFNIYDRDDVFVVTCYEGSVRVNSKTKSFILKKGDEIKITNEGVESKNIISSIPLWIEGKSFFTKATLSEVFAEIERQYDIKIKTTNIDLQRKYTGEFPHNDLDSALKIVCGAMGLKYKIQENNVVLITK